MSNVTHAPRLREAWRTRLKLLAQPHGFVAFGRDPFVPCLREALAAKELARACPARDDRSEAARPARHPGRCRVRAVVVGKMLEEETAEHVVPIDRPRAGIRLRLVEFRTVRLEHRRAQRLGKHGAANATAVGEA